MLHVARPNNGDERIGIGEVVSEILVVDVKHLLHDARTERTRFDSRRSDVIRNVHGADHRVALDREGVVEISRTLREHNFGTDGNTLAEHAVGRDEALPFRFRPPTVDQNEAVEIAIISGFDCHAIVARRRMRRFGQRVNASRVRHIVHDCQYIGLIRPHDLIDSRKLSQRIEVGIFEPHCGNDAHIVGVRRIEVAVEGDLHVGRRHAQPSVETGTERNDGEQSQEPAWLSRDGAQELFRESGHAARLPTTPAFRQKADSR